MEKITNSKQLLAHIRLTQGEHFQCDEQAILAELDDDIHAKQLSLSIKILSIIGGFLATLAFLIALVITGIYDSYLGVTILGGIFISGALVINQISKQLILDTFIISIYICGYPLLMYGLERMNVEEDAILLITIAISLFSLVFIRNFMLTFVAVLIASGATIGLVFYYEVYVFVHLYIGAVAVLLTYLGLHEAKFIAKGKRWMELYAPARISLVFSLLFGLITIGHRDVIDIQIDQLWISSGIIAGIVIYLVHRAIKSTKIVSNKTQISIYIVSLMLLLLTFFAPAISGATLIVLLSFSNNHKTGLVVGIIAMLYFISQYYYMLTWTLLTKSIILLSTGIGFLLLYFFITKITATNEKI